MFAESQNASRSGELLDLRTIVDMIPALAVCAFPDGSLEFVNQTWQEFTGYPPEQLSGWGWHAVIHPDDIPGFMGEWDAARAAGLPFENEVRVRRADGEYRWFLVKKVPQRDASGDIVRWYGIGYEIENLKIAEDRLRLVVDTTPALIHSARPDGYVDFLNKGWLDYLGLPLERVVGWLWTAAFHPDDVESFVGKWRAALATGEPFEAEGRVRRADGEYRTLLHRKVPLRDNLGNIVKWHGSSIDIEDRKRAANALQKNEFYLTEAQRLAHMGSWGFDPSGVFDFWSRELFLIYGLDPSNKPPTLDEYLALIHPEDREFMASTIQEMVAQSIGCDLKKRIVRPGGEVRYVRCVGIPVIDNGKLKRIVGSAIDVTEQEHLTQELRRREGYLAEAQRLSRTGSFGWRVSTGDIVLSGETLRIFEYDPAQKPTLDLVFQRIHPEDLPFVKSALEDAVQEGKSFDFQHRLMMPNGGVKNVHVVAHGTRDMAGELEFIGAVMDVTAAKEAENKIRLIIDTAPGLLWSARPDGWVDFIGKRWLDYTGMTMEEALGTGWQPAFHPDDLERVINELKKTLSSDSEQQTEARLRRNDGKYVWFLFRYNPLRDEQGRVLRWYVAGTDIEERKQEEERLQHENVALREEIDKASMFEEIVGTSPALHSVLSRVSKVAPTDSTVLLTGETGTGKELVARAIHRRSHRASRPFVSVNCSAVPRDLIASELFGHEKGAFTGAIQRRLGRFELACGGTIFLDEVGELPAETQVALLRVLQEHELERVGGTRSIPTDVRVIAATNRDLKAAIAAGAFRSDLFYRLNVFPIEVPPLRSRKEDIPLLVEYFIDRFARKTGKIIKGVNKRTLDLLQSCAWPGNIRELQNVIERSVIICESENLSVDESWISRPPHSAGLASSLDLAERLAAQEKEIIETALRACGGRVFGPSGAAAKLGMPRSTLESKIRSLKIDKNRFKLSPP
jgi:PAS domain S-box-containing protein